MIQTGLIPNAHSDLVTDACYDFYGLHLATSGLDQRYATFAPRSMTLETHSFSRFIRIKVWQMDERNGVWTVEDDWKVRDASLAPA